MAQTVRHIGLTYNNANSNESALKLVLTLFPEWEETKSNINFIRFTDGITNTLLKAENKQPGLSQHEIDQNAVLLRAYGSGTAVLIDRNRECVSHSLLASYKLAPPLLARFNNGLMYRYIEGKVCAPADLRRPDVWRPIARRLAEWHATIPISEVLSKGQTSAVLPGKPTPNIWDVMQKWITALSENTPEETARKGRLQEEFKWLVGQLGDAVGVDNQALVFGHCDLLCGNVIMEPSPSTPSEPPSPSPQTSMASTPTTMTSAAGSFALADPNTSNAVVSFIDYEYATPCPAAFDIANHFAEWGGFDCDFSVLPTRAQRRDFLRAYLDAYNSFRGRDKGAAADEEEEARTAAEFEVLFAQVDRFRGAPGFYWGVWALIQNKISSIDFDYASYAEMRLGEYFAWKGAVVGGVDGGESGVVREKRWAQEE